MSCYYHLFYLHIYTITLLLLSLVIKADMFFVALCICFLLGPVKPAELAQLEHSMKSNLTLRNVKITGDGAAPQEARIQSLIATNQQVTASGNTHTHSPTAEPVFI